MQTLNPILPLPVKHTLSSLLLPPSPVTPVTGLPPCVNTTTLPPSPFRLLVLPLHLSLLLLVSRVVDNSRTILLVLGARILALLGGVGMALGPRALGPALGHVARR